MHAHAHSYTYTHTYADTHLCEPLSRWHLHCPWLCGGSRGGVVFPGACRLWPLDSARCFCRRFAVEGLEWCTPCPAGDNARLLSPHGRFLPRLLWRDNSEHLQRELVAALSRKEVCHVAVRFCLWCLWSDKPDVEHGLCFRLEGKLNCFRVVQRHVHADKKEKAQWKGGVRRANKQKKTPKHKHTDTHTDTDADTGTSEKPLNKSEMMSTLGFVRAVGDATHPSSVVMVSMNPFEKGKRSMRMACCFAVVFLTTSGLEVLWPITTLPRSIGVEP